MSTTGTGTGTDFAPDVIVVGAGLAGLVTTHELALAGRRVLITGGRRDPICPAPATQKLADWYGAQGADVSLVWHDGGHEIRQEELIAIRDFLAR